jgi:hypothetical protein
MKSQCEFCHETVEAWHTAAFPITGWETERSQGGANQIKARTRIPDRIAHATCLAALRIIRSVIEDVQPR